LDSSLNVRAGDTSARAAAPFAPLRFLAIVALLAACALLLLALGMHQGLDHDEHQFVASGAVLVRQGLLPYRDYPYFHTPELIFVYALLFCWTDHLLLAARLVSVVAAVGSAGFIFLWSYGRLSHWPATKRFAAAALAALLFITNPIVTYTTGKAWNHDLPIFFTLLAFGATCRAATRRRWGWMLISGVLIGAAIGIRLTFAPVVLALGCMALAAPDLSQRQKGLAVTAFMAGVIAGLAPTFALFLLAPRQFIFGNFQYPMLNTLFRAAEGNDQATMPLVKLAYVIGHYVCKPGNLLLVAILLIALKLSRNIVRRTWETAWLGVLTLYLWIGAFAPTPAYEPYFYAVIPFVILWAISALAPLRPGDVAAAKWLPWSGSLAAVAILIGIGPYRHVAELFHPAKWAPMQIHEQGKFIATLSRHGPVFTLEPIYPLEGGSDVYPETVTGAFALRVAPLVREADELKLGEFDGDEFDALLWTHPCGAIMTGPEPTLEGPLIAAAERRHFYALHLGGRRILWLPTMPAVVIKPKAISNEPQLARSHDRMD